MNIKQRIIFLLDEFEKGKYSNILLNEYFMKNSLSKMERGFITEVFYGVIRNDIFLNYILEKRVKKIKKNWLKNLLKISIYQITFMDSDNSGVVWEAVELAKKRYGIQIGKFVNGVIRGYIRDKEVEIEELRTNKLNILYSYPEWFYKIVKEEYGERTENFFKSLKKVPYLSVRVNCLKYSCEEFEKLLEELKIQIIKKVDTVYYIDSGAIIHTQEFKDGKIVVQDGASFLAGKLLNPQKDEIVLDCCSAPGSKTSVLAEIMKNSGEIYALDIHPHKIKLIEENMQKLGVTNVKTMVLDARNIDKLDLEFDKILVDAPCSGFGVLRKKPEALYNKTLKNIDELADLQLEILETASKKLKKYGEIIYSTCTIFKRENTENIRKFLEKHKEFTPVKIEIPTNVSGTFDEFGGFLIDFTEEILDNFYIIKLRKDRE